MPYEVLTRKQAVLIIGASPWIFSKLQKKIEKTSLAVFGDISQVSDQFDLDYCLVFGSTLPSFAPHNPKVITIQGSTSANRLAGDISITHPDILGEEFVEAPILSLLISDAKNKKKITLPLDGLAPYYFVGDQDFINGIVETLFSPSAPPKLALTSGQSTSLLSLAYEIRPLLKGKVEVEFNDNLSPFPSGIDNKLLENAKELTLTQEQDLEDVLQPSVSSLLKTTPQPSNKTTKQLNNSPAIPAPVKQEEKLPKPEVSSKPKLRPLSELWETEAPPKKKRLETPKFLGKLKRLKKSAPAEPTFVPLDSTKQKSPKKLKTKKPKKKLSFKFKNPALLGVLLGLFVYFTGVIFALTVSALSVKDTIATLKEGSLPTTSSLKLAKSSTIFISANLTAIRSLPILDNSQTLEELSLLSNSYIESLDLLSLTNELSTTSKSILAYIMQGGEGLEENLNTAKLQTGELYEKLSLLAAGLPDAPPMIIPEKYQDQYLSLKTALVEARRGALAGKAMLASAPKILGVGDRRKYLVLFQNNMELRPTGGFIGSFAVLSFENGQLYDMPIYDVYSADGQLKGHVEPPVPIRDYLGEANWYMRDSNWDPDFPTSARRAEWFLGKTLGTDVQGTIGINVYTLQEILKATGAITLDDYQEEVSAANIFERAEYHSEVNFFPGSTAKKEFLSSVAENLFSRFQSSKDLEVVSLLRALATSIDGKNTQLALSDTSVDHTFSQLGWNGEIRTLPCSNLGGKETSTGCFADSIYLVDSNLGVNKANYFMKRSLELSLDIKENKEVSHILKATYQNTALDSSWPAGSYKNYSRLYLPANTILRNVFVDGVPLPEDKLDLGKEHNRTVIGFFHTVEINSVSVVEVEYETTEKLHGETPTYSLYWQKQSGTDEDPLIIKLSYPNGLIPDIVSPRADLDNNTLVFNLRNNTDRRLTVLFK